MQRSKRHLYSIPKPSAMSGNLHHFAIVAGRPSRSESLNADVLVRNGTKTNARCMLRFGGLILLRKMVYDIFDVHVPREACGLVARKIDVRSYQDA
jgi:hypothetical protein